MRNLYFGLLQPRFPRRLLQMPFVQINDAGGDAFEPNSLKGSRQFGADFRAQREHIQNPFRSRFGGHALAQVGHVVRRIVVEQGEQAVEVAVEFPALGFCLAVEYVFAHTNHLGALVAQVVGGLVGIGAGGADGERGGAARFGGIGCEACTEIAEFAACSGYFFAFGIGVAFDDFLQARVGDDPANALFFDFFRAFALGAELVAGLISHLVVGAEDELPPTSVFFVQFQYGVASGAGSGEEVEDDGWAFVLSCKSQ